MSKLLWSRADPDDFLGPPTVWLNTMSGSPMPSIGHSIPACNAPTVSTSCQPEAGSSTSSGWTFALSPGDELDVDLVVRTLDPDRRASVGSLPTRQMGSGVIAGTGGWREVVDSSAKFEIGPDLEVSAQLAGGRVHMALGQAWESTASLHDRNASFGRGGFAFLVGPDPVIVYDEVTGGMFATHFSDRPRRGGLRSNTGAERRTPGFLAEATRASA